MKLAIMQPYFLPYIGYFQLINAVDKFVVYDNIEFTKKGWIHRNRLLNNGKDYLFSLPLKKDSDYLNVNQRELSVDFFVYKSKILRKIENDYKKAPYFETVSPLIEKIFNDSEINLFQFIFFSINEIVKFLSINTQIIISSEISIDHSLKSQDKVIALCKELSASNYYNPIGGVDLYNKNDFLQNNISLNFIKSKKIEYKQLENVFIPWLSIVDILMFNSKEEVLKMLDNYEII
ncbi:MAG: WbqC family protein [Flavobacteriaceae bacterium]|nr:WbqC family protein [Flavobacteriaceae bacterium]